MALSEDTKALLKSALIGGITTGVLYYLVQTVDAFALSDMIPEGAATATVAGAIGAYAGPKIANLLPLQ